MMDPDKVFDVCQAIKTAEINYYAAQGVELPERAYVAAQPVGIVNDITDDDCGEQLVVSCERAVGNEGDPAPLQSYTANRQGAGWAMRSGVFQVSITRCFEQPDLNAQTTVEEEEDASRMVYGDSIRMLNALIVAVKAGDLPGCSSVVFLDWSAPEVEAGVVTGTLRVAVGLATGV